MSRRTLPLFGLLAAVSAQEAAAPRVPLPTIANVAAWRDHILPTADELRWQQIPWRQSFGDGIRAADEAGRPLLFWAMNGHPLGCT